MTELHAGDNFLHASSLLGSIAGPENGGDICLRNTSRYQTDYTSQNIQLSITTDIRTSDPSLSNILHFCVELCLKYVSNYN
jgi:hypothetical protein